MSDAILSGDLTVYWKDENRRKQIRWTGGTDVTDYQKMIDIYDACEDLSTQPANQNQGLIFSAQTPGEYTIGKIDAGELDPWFIDLASMEHLIGDYKAFTGCAIKTSGWARVQDSNVGIVVVAVANATNDIVIGDIGYDIVHDDLDAGTLLDVVVPGGATDYLFIRPDTYGVANNFNSVADDLTCNLHTATQEAAAVTGEMIWGNPYSKGGIQGDTHVYIFQDGARVTKIGSSTQDWWGDGHIDRAVPLTDYTAAAFPLIDEGYLTVFARKYGTKHSYDVIGMNTTSGGNVSAALGSGVDGNNTTGYKSITFTASANNWSVGDEMTGDSSDARAIITKIDTPGATQTVHYYLVGDPMTDFNTTVETLTNEDDTGTGTKNDQAPAAQGPALAGWFENAAVPTIAFANTTADIDENGTDDPFAITIDINQATLAQMYEWTKYIQMRGSVIDMDGLDGQEWYGLDYRVNYSGTVNGTVGEGSVVDGVTSGATGLVVSHDTTLKVMMLRNSRGTFVDAEQIQVDGANYIPASGTTVTSLTPILENSLMTKAGSLIIGAVGVLFSDYRSAQTNSFQVYDCNGILREAPISVSMALSNLLVADWASCHRLTGAAGDINKEEYQAYGGEAIGDATLDVDTTLAVDVPGKALGGRLILVDVSDDNKEYVLRYDSYVNTGGAGTDGSFTLSNVVIASAEALTSPTKIVFTGAFTNAEVGDLVYNHTRSLTSYISEIIDNDEANCYPAIALQAPTDSIELNCCPIAVLAADFVYVEIILTYIAAGSTASATIVYLAPIYTRVRVRNTGDAATKIKGYTADITITDAGGAAVATRIENPVYGA